MRGYTYLEGLILVLIQYIEAFLLLHQVSKQQLHRRIENLVGKKITEMRVAQGRKKRREAAGENIELKQK